MMGLIEQTSGEQRGVRMTGRTDLGARLTAALLMAAVCAAQSATVQEASERSAAEVAVPLAHPNIFKNDKGKI